MADGSEVVGRRLTADVVLFTKRDGVLAVLVVERRKDPFRGALALPGGFLESGERAADAAVRELAEETGLVVARDRLRRFGRYGKHGRDPRGEVESVAFHAYVAGAPVLVSGGDAALARWVTVAEFFDAGTSVAFDHRDILRDAIVRRFGFQARMEFLGNVHFSSP